MKAKQVMRTTVLLLVSVAYAQQPDSPRPERIRVSGGVANGILQHRVEPTYPWKAKENHIQGAVVLAAVISKEGNLIELKVVSGDPVLAQASLEAIKQWKYRPYLLQGEPVE